ncbi:MAG: tetratricopeptide repeat protein, partial [Acidobacteriota bacterium]
YYPLTWLSHMADVSLFGLDPRGPHLVSLLLHTASALLLFLFLDGGTGDRLRSFLAAGLFALHPLHVESAAWISERKDVLSVFFLFLALLAYLRYARRPGMGRYLPVFLLLLASLSAKPTAVTAPFLLLLVDYWPLGRLAEGRGGAAGPFPVVGWRRALLEKVPFLALSLLFGLATLAAQRSLGAVTGLSVLPLSLRVENAAVSAAAYLAKAFVPAGLTVFYPFPREGYPPGEVLLAVALLGLATAAALREVQRRPFLFTGWFWYLVALGPMLGIVQAGRQAMADRYTYVPLVGVSVALLWALPAASGGAARRAFAAAGALVLLLLGALSFRQARFWKDDGTLFGHALAVTPHSYLAHWNVGMVRLEEGRTAEAEAFFRRALQLEPRCTEAKVNLAILLLQRGEEQGLGLLEEAVAEAPRFTAARLNLASALWRRGRLGEAEAQLRAAVSSDGESAEALRRLGALLLDPRREGGPRPAEAVSFLERAARISGRREPRILVQLAEAQRAGGKEEAARGTAREAVEEARRRGDREAEARAVRLLEGRR